MIGNWASGGLDVAQWGNRSELSGPIEESRAKACSPRTCLTDCAVELAGENHYANGVTLVHIDNATAKEHPLQVAGHGRGVLFLGAEGWIHADRPRP